MGGQVALGAAAGAPREEEGGTASPDRHPARDDAGPPARTMMPEVDLRAQPQSRCPNVTNKFSVDRNGRFSGRARGTPAQWRKCRTPVRSIVAPAASTTAIASASLREPPGWTNAVTPASRQASIASGNG